MASTVVEVISPTTKQQSPQVASETQIAKESNRIHGFIAGVASGVTKLTVGHPFDTIKVRLQTTGTTGRFKGPIDCLISTLRKEGFRALYKGATPPLIGWVFLDSIMLGSLHNYRLLLQGNDPNVKLNVLQHSLAGGVAFFATPFEQVKARLQVQYDSTTRTYNGPIDCVKKLVKNNGIVGLWRGLSGNLLFRSWLSVFWGSYELYSIWLRKLNLNEASINFLAGGLNTVKNRMMAQPDIKPLQFPTLRGCISQIYRTEGINGFYRGFIPCILRSFPANACAI
ncbi:11391_t:CDS:10, partial [Entrophospora sp. SA101]